MDLTLDVEYLVMLRISFGGLRNLVGILASTTSTTSSTPMPDYIKLTECMMHGGPPPEG